MCNRCTSVTLFSFAVFSSERGVASPQRAIGEEEVGERSDRYGAGDENEDVDADHRWSLIFFGGDPADMHAREPDQAHHHSKKGQRWHQEEQRHGRVGDKITADAIDKVLLVSKTYESEEWDEEKLEDRDLEQHRETFACLHLCLSQL